MEEPSYPHQIPSFVGYACILPAIPVQPGVGTLDLTGSGTSTVNRTNVGFRVVLESRSPT